MSKDQIISSLVISLLILLIFLHDYVTLYWYYLKVKYTLKNTFSKPRTVHILRKMYQKIYTWQLSRPPFKCCIMQKLRNVNVPSVDKMKNPFELKICKDPIMQHICFIYGASNVTCMQISRGRGLIYMIVNFLPQKRGGVKLVGEFTCNRGFMVHASRCL